MKNMIQKEFESLVIEKKNLKFSINDLCQKAQISRQTFYKYYKDKYEIIEEVIKTDLVAPLYPLMDNKVDPIEIMENWYMTFLKNKDFYIIIMKEEGQNSFFESLIKYLCELHKLCLKEQSIDNEQDLDYLAYKFSSMQAMLLKKWFDDGMNISPKKMAYYCRYNMPLKY